ncbi:MAG: DUF1840 domain-containing protein [Rubrivivax sp.]|jgi:hypothetical protein
MIYKFKSPATADLLMMGPQGDQLLRLLGREPAAQGIFEAAALPGLVQTLKAAIDAEEARLAAAAAARAEGLAGAGLAGEGAGAEDEGDTMAAGLNAVALRQRAWPLLEMFKRASEAGKPVVWGA